MYATGQFPALVETGLPLEGLQFALLMYALLSVIFIGLSIRMNVTLTALFTCIALAYFCLGIGQTHGERVVKVSTCMLHLCTPSCIWCAHMEALIELCIHLSHSIVMCVQP